MSSVFHKDILYGGLRLDEEFPYGDGASNAAHFILYNAKVLGEIDTDIGIAVKTGLVVAPLTAPTDVKVVGTLAGPIAEKFAAVDDLASDPLMPAVVAVFKTPAKNNAHNDATVLQFERKWDGEVPDALPTLQAVAETPL